MSSSNHNIELMEQIAEIRETLARNTAILEVNTDQLAIHIKRSEAIEERVEQYRDETNKKLEEALLPIRTAKAVAMFAGYITAISTSVFALVQFIRFVTKAL